MTEPVLRRPAVARLSSIVSVVLAIVSVLPLIPPKPDRSLDNGGFSAELALEHIERLAQSPRPMGSADNARGRDEITRQLRQLGLDPQLQTIRVPDYFGSSHDLVEAANVMVRVPGTDPTGAVLLVGHHDTVPTTLGANDDTSAVAVLLEIARSLVEQEPVRNDVILLFTDGEEPAPRYGSTAFAESHPWMTDVRFVANLEAIGSAGVPLVIDISGSSRWISGVYALAAPYPAAYSFVTAVSKLIGGSNTDFAPFRDVGIPGIDVAYIVGSPIYHTMADNPDTVSRRSLFQHGANASALARTLGEIDLGVDRGNEEGVFFTVARFYVIRYPTSWSRWLLAVGAILLVTAGWHQGGRRRVLLSTFLTVGVALVASSIAVPLWTAIGRSRPSMGIAESYAYLGAFAGLCALLEGLVSRLFRRHVTAGHDLLGTLLVWWMLGLAGTLLAPGTSYLFIWPSLAGGLVLLLRRGRGFSCLRRAVGEGVLAGITLLLVVPAIDFFYQLAQPRPGNPDSEVLLTIIIPVALLALTLDLLRALRRQALLVREG